MISLEDKADLIRDVIAMYYEDKPDEIGDARATIRAIGCILDYSIGDDKYD